MLECGRGLAPDSGGSVKVASADPLLSGASPLPHFEQRCAYHFHKAGQF
ncbi:hypothetical protein C4J97_3356 [Pseudomonas orientalis]|nr:hypothetical protein C4J97_3356 [Pseudomonas orientalis]